MMEMPIAQDEPGNHEEQQWNIDVANNVLPKYLLDAMKAMTGQFNKLGQIFTQLNIL